MYFLMCKWKKRFSFRPLSFAIGYFWIFLTVFNFQILKSCDSEFVPKLVATFETQNNYYLIQQYISWVFKKMFRTVDFLTVYDMGRVIWGMSYAPCFMVHMIWPVWYGPYHMDQYFWNPCQWWRLLLPSVARKARGFK